MCCVCLKSSLRRSIKRNREKSIDLNGWIFDKNGLSTEALSGSCPEAEMQEPRHFEPENAGVSDRVKGEVLASKSCDFKPFDSL